MATYSLDITADDYFDFDIFTITCQESIYSLVYHLNEAFDIDLQLNDLLDFTHKSAGDFYFPLYTFIQDELNIEFNVLPNVTSFQQQLAQSIKTPTLDLFSGEIEQYVSLIPELSTINYFLLIKGEMRYQYNYMILETLKKIPICTKASELFTDHLVDKKIAKNLVF